MTSFTIPEEHLREANAELRARLEEAEDTLRAIRSGEVEALVVETADGRRSSCYKASTPNQTVFAASSSGRSATP